jgi:hypothetical protein
MVQPQALARTKQALYHLSLATSTLCFEYVSDHAFCPRLTLDFDTHTYASCIAEITGMNQHA